VVGGSATAGLVPRTCTATDDRMVVGGAKDGRAALVDGRLRRPNADETTDPEALDRDVLPPSMADDDGIYCSADAGGGRIAVGSVGPARSRPAIAVIDPDDHAAARVTRLPREAVVDAIAVIDGAVVATARPSGAVYRVDMASGALQQLAVPVPMAETRTVAGLDGTIVGVAADGSAWTHEPGTRSTTVHDVDALGLERRGQRVQSIAATAGRVEVGGSFTISRHDLTTGTTDTRFLPGEAKAMVVVDDVTYLAVYPIGEIWAWPGSGAGPRRVTQLDDDQLRPIALAHSAQLGALVATSTDDARRSCVHVIDPVTGRIEVVDRPLGDQTVSGLAVSGSTAYVGGSGSRPSLLALDLGSGRVLWTIDEVVPDGGFVLGLDRQGDRLSVTTSKGWFTTVHLPTRRVTPPVQVADAAGALRRAGDALLLATPDAVLSLDSATLRATALRTGLGGRFWGWPSMDVDPDGLVWAVQDRALIRFDPADPAR
jgi:outer membrane protein assembly factor BamB